MIVICQAYWLFIKIQGLTWKFNENNGLISHPSNTDGWKEYEEDMIDKISQGYKPLFPVIFMDEFEITHQRHSKVTGVYTALVNETGVPVSKRLIIFNNI